LKTIAWMRQVKVRGLANVDWLFVFASAAFNLIRLPKLLPQPVSRRRPISPDALGRLATAAASREPEPRHAVDHSHGREPSHN
jgi:hypothetical protein